MSPKAVRKTVPKTTQKTARKTTRKPAQKTARKTTKKTTQKTVRKTTQKVIRKVIRKTAKKKVPETIQEKPLLEQLYRSYEENGKKKKDSGDLLVQTNWLFSVISDFDPKTGDALPQALSTFLANITNPLDDGILHDRLWRITEHVRGSVKRLFRALNESPRREQAFLHIRAVRELDATSFIKLSGLPGRNIREKIRDKPYLYAVRRFQSVDLPENRLLKKFVTRLAELLKLRCDCLKEEEDELLPKIKSWLLGDEAKSIARWENLPPNNTLLSHRDYRRILDAWGWLQTLEDDIKGDLKEVKSRKKTMDLWRDIYGQKYSDGHFIFADMPVYFNYKNFEIIPWEKKLESKDPESQTSKKKIARDYKTVKIEEPVCVDFSAVRPCYVCASDISRENNDNKYRILDETYIWQHWENKNEKKIFNFELFNSDALFLHKDAVTISSSDLFYSKDKRIEHLELAASSFTYKLQKTFTDDTFIWLVPDYLNDFELNITRRNVNARFQKAEPLPRSVAAVFEKIDYSEIKNAGYSVVVLDTVGGKFCKIKFIARFDEELKKLIPETFGFYWVRCPPVIVDQDDSKDTQKKNCEIIAYDEKDGWTQPNTPKLIDENALKNNERIGHFDFCIKENPVLGGISYYKLQKEAGKFRLWRYNIPELKIKTLKDDGRYDDCILVSCNETISPIPGEAVDITIKYIFTLRAGKHRFRFPLFQGENEEEIGYSATLESNDFPLAEDTKYNLNLTFTYGANEPYCLKFEPEGGGKLSSIMAEWRANENITDAPDPKYPTPLSWEKLKQWKDAQGKEVDLLFDWLPESLNKLINIIPNRSSLTIYKRWEQRSNDKGEEYWFTFANTEYGECYCNSYNIIDLFQNNPNEVFPVGTRCFGNVLRRDNGKLYAVDISKTENSSFSKETENKLLRFREKSLQNRIPIIWADNRSWDDADASEFKQNINDKILILSKRLPKNVYNNKLIPLLCCLHKDTNNDCINWIMKQVEEGQIHDHRAIGFSLGDVSQEWQQNVMEQLLFLIDKKNEKALRVFAYAIWHEQNFYNVFNIDDLKSILNYLKEILNQIQPCPAKKHDKDKWTVRNWIRSTAEPLELLLGLLRTRKSSKQNIKMLLQPNQPITKELAKLIENIIGICAQSNIKLFSRVQLFDLYKPESFSIPDILYALRLYLTGDDGADAIQTAGVSDNDDENEND